VPENDGLNRYLKAGMTFTEVTRSRADEAVRELIRTGEIERHKAQDWVGGLVKTSRDRSTAFISSVRGEVSKPFKGLGFTNVHGRATKSGDTPSPSSVSPPQANGRAAKKTPTATKTPAKKSAARKAPTKKGAAGARTRAGSKKTG
jgi:hypothetical protein